MYIDMKAALTCALKTVFRKKLENCARLLCFRPKPDAPTIADKSRKSPRMVTQSKKVKSGQEREIHPIFS